MTLISKKKNGVSAVSYAVRYISNVKDTLIHMGMSNVVAERAAHDQKFIGLLHSDPEFVMHHEPEYWAEVLHEKYSNN